jgi:oligopeptide/dipeptide ABC transporter ATP-binding protein
VTLQAGILSLLRRLAAREGLGVLLVTHDLGVVSSACDRVLVMYAGRLVEEGPAGDLLASPKHPYTAALLRAAPSPEIPRGHLAVIPGAVPDFANLPEGCAFHPRCPVATDACRLAVPPLARLESGRRSACLLGDDGPRGWRDGVEAAS